MVVRKPKENKEPSEKKPDSSLSRARRMVLEYALCNDWMFFCTFTLDKEKYDRFNLDAWHKDFLQWIRDQRKKYKKLGYDVDFKFLLVPELHQDGAWHMHGLMSDIRIAACPFFCERKRGLFVPDNLVDGKYFDWPEYRKKFGYCSLGLIRSKVQTAFYISKYISKDLTSLCEKVGAHCYYPSRGLQRAEKHGDIYGYTGVFDRWLVNDYEFVRTGMTSVSDCLDWTFGIDYFDYNSFFKPFSYEDLSEEDRKKFEYYFDVLEGEQSVMEGFN